MTGQTTESRREKRRSETLLFSVFLAGAALCPALCLAHMSKFTAHKAAPVAFTAPHLPSAVTLPPGPRPANPPPSTHQS